MENAKQSLPVNLMAYEALARGLLEPMAFDYFVGGANDELTLAENRAAFERLKLRPHVLRDVEKRDLTTTLLGHTLPWPLATAPMAFMQLAHPEGELALARAAGEAGIPVTLSTLASYSIEEVAAVASGPLWFQLYQYRDRAITRDIVQRAEAAGYSAIFPTADVAASGRRERDERHPFRLPAGISVKNLAAYTVAAEPEAGESAVYATTGLMKESFTLADLEWLCSMTRLPVLVKGVLRGDDAVLALEHGAAGVVVSNHGGRQLDTAVASIAALPEVAAAVDGRAPILLDGGVRRGTDIIKALALGAQAVLLGRPLLWGLAADGAAGAGRVLALLRQEFDIALALCGCTCVGDVTADLVLGP